MSREKTFERAGGIQIEDQRRPPEDAGLGKFGREVLKTAVMAAVVYFVTTAASRPAATDVTLAALDKRTALLEQAMVDMKDDVRAIKRAVTRER